MRQQESRGTGVERQEVNSIKRLQNDDAVKARVWTDDFGSANFVPCAMLAGVFGLRHLEDAQERGLTLFWSHSIQEMLNFTEATRP